MIAALVELDKGVHFRVEIVRPGTWEGFQNVLGREKVGFWDVVRVDVPARDGQVLF